MFKCETTKAGEVVVKRIFNNETSVSSCEKLAGYNITFIRSTIRDLDELRARGRCMPLSRIMENLGIVPEAEDVIFGYGRKDEMRIKIRKRRNLENQYILTFYGLRSLPRIYLRDS